MPAAPAFDASMRIVVLHGKDRFLLPHWTARLAAVLEDAHGEIELFVFDGETATTAAVLDELRSHGLFQQHKLVVVDHADRFLADRGGAAGTGARRALERYAESPMESSTLLLRAETWRRGKIDRLIVRRGLIVKVESPSPDEAMRWCIGRAASVHETAIEDEAVSLLVHCIGCDLARLDAELAKLAAHAGGEPIRRTGVVELVGLSREEQAWELQSALVSGDPALAARRFRELVEVSRQPQELLGWSIVDLLRKLHAGAAMVRRGAPHREICTTQRIFGPSTEAILRLAERVDRTRLAHLLDEAVETATRIRRGEGDAFRSLEMLSIRVTIDLARVA